MKTENSVLVTGANGFLGSWVCSEFLRLGWKVTALSRQPVENLPFPLVVLPIWTESSLISLISELKPDAVVHTAAMSSTAESERNEELTRLANTELPKILAAITGKQGIRLVHCSTDLVFDGLKGNYSETDPVNPQHVYGRTKVAAELAIPDLNPDFLIFRLSLLFGFSLDGNHGFLDGFVKSLQSGRPQPAFTDEWRTATPVSVATKLIADSVTHPIKSGLYHVASDEKLNRFEMACMLAERLGFSTDLILPAKLESFTGKPVRQPDVSMNNQKLKSALGISEIPGISSEETVRKLLF